MSDFRENLHPTVSKAEYTLFAELQRLGLTRGMVTQKKYQIKTPDGETIEVTPDFTWQLQRKMLFLDGDKVHKGWRIDRDNELVSWLPANDWDGLRIRYHAPLKNPSIQLDQIIKEIRKWFGER